MPHPKYLFHCGRQKRDNTSAIKMLHQMCVWVAVVVVALGLVLTVLTLVAQVVYQHRRRPGEGFHRTIEMIPARSW